MGLGLGLGLGLGSGEEVVQSVHGGRDPVRLALVGDEWQRLECRLEVRVRVRVRVSPKLAWKT